MSDDKTRPGGLDRSLPSPSEDHGVRDRAPKLGVAADVQRELGGGR